MIATLLLAGVFLAQSSGAQPLPSRVQVRMVTDEADAVLAILVKRKAGAEVDDTDWQRLFESEGYRRLKKREAAIGRSFDDTTFKTFVLSVDLLARADAERETLTRWKKSDITSPARRALAYLPGTATIRATVYPEIKPWTNSFVFEVDTDPAIFLYIDPGVTREQFENTVAHELHHIGYGTTCPSTGTEAWLAGQPASVKQAAKWTGAFGEGFAMLAAAGGPVVHPHAVSKPEDRQRWDRDVANYSRDLKELDGFFRQILSGKLSTEETNKQAFSYFGTQGPWYTVGWKMAVTVEKTYGRKRLVEAMCDGPAFLSIYNQAANELAKREGGTPVLWSEEIIKAFEPAEK
jgi:Putative zinc dependent peptidase (DUF5700)